MPSGSSPKRERQYEHIESSARKRGASAGRAKEIAAATVNKQRAQSGETSGSSGGSSSRGAGSKSKSSSDSKRSTSTSRSTSSNSSSSSRSKSSGRSGGSRSSAGSSGSSNTTFRELYAEAQRRDIKGRSTMDKAQLERALAGSGGKRGK